MSKSIEYHDPLDDRAPEARRRLAVELRSELKQSGLSIRAATDEMRALHDHWRWGKNTIWRLLACESALPDLQLLSALQQTLEHKSGSKGADLRRMGEAITRETLAARRKRP